MQNRTRPNARDHYRSRLDDLREAMQPDEFGDTRTHELPLSIERETTYRVVLGTGGPHDEVRLSINAHGEVTGGSYLRVWGLDRDTCDLDTSEAQEWADALSLEVGQ
ncbi:MAG: hypothetical protein JJT89_06560 [Nitriliruptoraceae bacterium]|nr:hypothetical protein [Nitriliruptoraceae bacterium]